MTKLNQFLEKEKQLMDKATPGPWVGDEFEMTAPKAPTLMPGNVRLVWAEDYHVGEYDAAFIANVRTSHALALEALKIAERFSKEHCECAEFDLEAPERCVHCELLARIEKILK